MTARWLPTVRPSAILPHRRKDGPPRRRKDGKFDRRYTPEDYPPGAAPTTLRCVVCAAPVYRFDGQRKLKSFVKRGRKIVMWLPENRGWCPECRVAFSFDMGIPPVAYPTPTRGPTAV